MGCGSSKDAPVKTQGVCRSILNLSFPRLASASHNPLHLPPIILAGWQGQEV